MESAILNLLGACLLTYAPAYVANMSPPVAHWLRLPFARPIAVAALGAHKTYLGILSGVAGGAVTSLALWSLGFGWYASHTAVGALGAGALIGLGAMLGDALKSGVKRRVGIAPGRPFVPWDQIDFILGSTVALVWLGMGDWALLLTAVVITPLLHLIVNVAAYKVGFKDVWW